MTNLAGLKEMKRLDLAGVDITEDSLENLAGMILLEDLDLSFARFSETT